MESLPRSHPVKQRCWIGQTKKYQSQEGLHGLEQEELDDAWLWVVGWRFGPAFVWVIIRNSSPHGAKKLDWRLFFRQKLWKSLPFTSAYYIEILGGKLAHFFAAEEISRPVETSMGFEAQGRLQVGWVQKNRGSWGVGSWADKGPSVWSKEFQGNFRKVLMGLPGDDDWGLWDYFAGMFLVFFRFNLTDLHSQMMSLANDGSNQVSQHEAKEKSSTSCRVDYISTGQSH